MAKSYNNIEADTLEEAGFVDPDSDDFHLLGTSPAVEAGSGTGYAPFDHDDVPRPQGRRADIGAYERILEGPAMRYRVERILTQAGTRRLYVDVAFLAGGGQVIHRNDFIMDIRQASGAAVAIRGNIAAYAARTDFASAARDRRDRRIRTEDTDPLGLRARPGVAGLIGAEVDL